MPRMTCTPETEVIGRIMVPYLVNLAPEKIGSLVQKYQLIGIKPDEWYPLQPWLGFLNDMSTQHDFASSMVAVGIKITEFAVSSPRMAHVTLGQVLERWDENFRANYRNGEVGHITVEKLHDKCYRTIHQHIYPDDLNYGMLYGFAKAKLPKDTDFTVWYEDYEHRLDRGGGDRTAICVEWE